jgi:type II secretory pathway pseudopilin PulG
VAGLLLVIGLLAVLLAPAVTEARHEAQKVQCMNNLRQIGTALHQYHQVHGAFPPAYTTNASGKPMHSWRALLLPFIVDHSGAADGYRFDEPWDSAHNQVFAHHPPAIFRCPHGEHQAPGETSYVVVTGSETLFDGDQALSMGDISDGLSNTILVVEVGNSGVNWLEPRDLPLEQTTFGGASGRLGGIHPDGALVLMADGSVRMIPVDLPSEQIRALITPRGGEPVVPQF